MKNKTDYINKPRKTTQTVSYHFGAKIRDTISGLTGIVVARAQYADGSYQIGIEAKANGNKRAAIEWIDAYRLVNA